MFYPECRDPVEDDDVSEDHPDVVMDLLWRLSVYNSSAVPVRYPNLDYRSDPKLNGEIIFIIFTKT